MTKKVCQQCKGTGRVACEITRDGKTSERSASCNCPRGSKYVAYTSIDNIFPNGFEMVGNTAVAKKLKWE